MSEVRILQSSMFGTVRTIEENGKPLFCGNDVAKALGYRSPKDAVAAHCKGAVKRRPLTNGGKQDVKFIPEGDVYRLIVKSKLPEAEKFEHWLFDDALPTIRQTGGYVNNEQLFINTYLPHADASTKMLFSSTLQTIRNMDRQLEEQKPLVEFAETIQGSKTSILVRQMAKLASNHVGIKIGEKRLYKQLREWGLILKTKNEPTQRAKEQGLLELIERPFCKKGYCGIAITTMVTPKGQKYIITQLIDKYNKGVT